MTNSSTADRRVIRAARLATMRDAGRRDAEFAEHRDDPTFCTPPTKRARRRRAAQAGSAA